MKHILFVLVVILGLADLSNGQKIEVVDAWSGCTGCVGIIPEGQSYPETSTNYTITLKFDKSYKIAAKFLWIKSNGENAEITRLDLKIYGYFFKEKFNSFEKKIAKVNSNKSLLLMSDTKYGITKKNPPQKFTKSALLLILVNGKKKYLEINDFKQSPLPQ